MFEGHLSLTAVKNYSTVNFPPLNVFWFFENYFYKDVSIMSPCSLSQVNIAGIKCHHSYYGPRYVLLYQHAGRKKSWNEASELCRRTDAHLPVFQSREDLDELLIFLKSIYGFPPLKDCILV